MSERLNEYRHVWEDRSGRYALFQVDESRGSDPKTCLVYDAETKGLLAEDDEELYDALRAKLVETGVPIIFDLPEDG